MVHAESNPIGFSLFVGPRSFRSWDNAVAYAFLPPDPNITVAPRRRVYLGSSGRWIVAQTTALRGGRG